MPSLRERLYWDAEAGALHDGPRRYLMMRPDVLMGAIAALDAHAQAALLDALAASIARHGADSLRAYADQVGGDPNALMASTAEAAADLGWGQWTLQRHGDELHLGVVNSPFVQGWRAAVESVERPATSIPPKPSDLPAAHASAHAPGHTAVCAPISGMLQALATQILQVPAQSVECSCAAHGADTCRFIAKPLA